MRRLFACLLIVFLSFVGTISAQDEELLESYYAYISEFTSDGFVLNYMDLPSLTVARQVEVEFPTHASNMASFVSPDGKWVAVVYDTQLPYGGGTFLVDAITGSTRGLRAGTIHPMLFNPDFRLEGLSPSVDWSPDSKYLASIGYEKDAHDQIVIEIMDKDMVMFRNSAFLYTTLAWNHTGDQFAYVAYYCEDRCLPYIEVYDINTGTVLLSTDVPEDSSIINTVCTLQWSPDGQYLSFVNACETSAYDAIKEVWVLNISTGQITNATHLTDDAAIIPDPSNPGLIGRFAGYDTYWLDANRLIIGANYAVDVSNNGVARTFIYDVETQTLIAIGDLRASEFAVDTVHGQLSIVVLDDGELLQDMRIVPLSAIDTFQDVPTFPPGCDLAWNHEGTVLAYTVRADVSANCRNTIEQFIFVDAVNGSFVEIPIDDGNDVIPVGWVVVPAQ